MRRHQRSIQEFPTVCDGALFAHRGLFERSRPHYVGLKSYVGLESSAGGLKVKRESRNEGEGGEEAGGVGS